MNQNRYPDSLRPLRRGHVMSLATLDEMVLYDPVTRSAFGLNVSASTIWSMCDGTRSIGEILVDLAKLVGSRPEEIRADVERVLEEFQAREVLAFEPGTPTEGVEEAS
jgi:hypothetical protein